MANLHIVVFVQIREYDKINVFTIAYHRLKAKWGFLKGGHFEVIFALAVGVFEIQIKKEYR